MTPASRVDEGVAAGVDSAVAVVRDVKASRVVHGGAVLVVRDSEIAVVVRSRVVAEVVLSRVRSRAHRVPVASRRVRAEEGAVAGRSGLRSDGAVVGPIAVGGRS